MLRRFALLPVKCPAAQTHFTPLYVLKNFFVPVMKLQEKTRVGGKYHKRYDKARTSADRMLECEGINREKAAWIRELNPFDLQE